MARNTKEVWMVSEEHGEMPVYSKEHREWNEKNGWKVRPAKRSNIPKKPPVDTHNLLAD